MIFGFDKFYKDEEDGKMKPSCNCFPADFINNVSSVAHGLFGHEMEKDIKDSNLFAPERWDQKVVDTTDTDNKIFSRLLSVEVKFIDHIEGKYYLPLYIKYVDFWNNSEARYLNLSNRALSDLRYGKSKLLVIFLGEAMTHNYDAVNLFNSWVANYELPNNKPITVVSGSHDFHHIFKRETTYKHIVFDYWECDINKVHTQNYSLLRDNIISRHNRSKFFLCYNRRIKNHRTRIVYGLKQRDLLGNGFVSYGLPLDDKAEEGIMKITNDHEFLNFLPMSFDNRDLDLNWAIDFVLKDYVESYFHIVTESWGHDDIENTFFSEKIFKPIMGMQPFFLVSSPNSLKRLRTLGYKTFSKWFDESYDQCKSNKERILKILDEVERLCKLSQEELQNMLIEMLPILDHNYKNLKKNGIENKRKLQKDLEDELWK